MESKDVIINNEIIFRLPTIYQGILRWGYGETRLDIDYVEESILFALRMIQTRNNDKIKTIIDRKYLYKSD